MVELPNRRPEQLNAKELKVLRAAQEGLKLIDRPFQALGEAVRMQEEDVIDVLKELERRGVVRRFAATIGHLALGITANAMIAWAVPEMDVDRVGMIMAAREEVTHCYLRDSYPHWPYNLYTMVHSRSRDECRRVAEELSRTSGIVEYTILFSEHEYKKTSARI